MCQMCTFYDNIEVSNLPHSNPFSEPSPHFPIHVASPSQNSPVPAITPEALEIETIPRFPSLYGVSLFIGSDFSLATTPKCTCSASRTDELFFDLSNELCSSCVAATETSSLVPRPLHRQRRINTLLNTSAAAEDESSLFGPASPDFSCSSMSDEDEFSYLSKNTRIGLWERRRKSKHVTFTFDEPDLLNQVFAVDKKPNRLQKKRRPTSS